MPPTRKNASSRNRKIMAGRDTFDPSTASPNRVEEPTSPKTYANWISAGLIVLALFMIHKGFVSWGNILIGLGVITLLSQSIRLDKLDKWKPNLGPLSHWKPSYIVMLLVLALAGFYVSLLAFPSHRWMFPSVQALPFQYSDWWLLGFWAAMAVFVSLLPPLETPADLSPKTTRLLFLVILGLALFLVIYRPLWPLGAHSEDNSVQVTPARLVNQLGDWKVFFDAGIGSSWQNFCATLASLVWVVVPGLSTLAVLKTTNVLIEVAFILFIYFAGTEAMNRRAGLFAAALFAVSHPIITKSVAGLRGNAHAMVVMLSIWLFFRAMNRPKMSNFLWWGASVALTVYTYLVNRPFVFVAVVGALAWILIKQKEERKMDRATLFLVGGTLGTLFIYIIYTNKLYATDNFISRAIDVAGYSLPCAALACLFIMGLYLWPKVSASGKYPYLAGWIAATWLVILLSFPKMADPYEYLMIQSSGIPAGMSSNFKPIQGLSILFDLNGSDWVNHHVPGDSFFGLLEITLGALGLALAVIRPNLQSLYLIGVFAFYCAIWLFSISYHTERLQPCTGPFILLGGLALEQVWSWFYALIHNRVAHVLFLGSFAGLLIWTAQAEFDQVHVQYVDRFVDVDAGVWRRASLDEANGYHVYYGPNAFFGRGGYVLNENKPLEILQPHNLITLDANEKLQDVVVYLRKSQPVHDTDDQFSNRIHALFPDAQWEDIRNPWDTWTFNWLLAQRCVIPAADLLKPQDLFAVQTVPSPCWTRSYFYFENALHPGLVEWKTRIAQADAPPPDGALARGDELVRYEGTINVIQPGKYDLVAKASKLTDVIVDGDEVINMVFPYTSRFNYSGPGETRVKSMRLSQGPHSLQITTFTQGANNLADIRWRREGDKSDGTPVWNSFTWQ